MRLAAVDLGATSGRVMAGRVDPGSVRTGVRPRLELEESHRFANVPFRVGRQGGSTLHWDVEGLYRETLNGLRVAGPVDGIGIDSWAVDYGLLDAQGTLIGNPVHYRDARTEGVLERVVSQVTERRLFDVTGLQRLPFNTLYQLLSEQDRLAAAETMLLIPDLLAYWLTGEKGAERTNASTTQLYDIRTGTWATELAEQVGVPVGLLPPLRDTGDRIGTLLPGLAAELNLPQVPVVAVASHDTASAVVGTPAEPGARFAYISSGTWSLVGLELAKPELGDAALAAGFTNETGLDGTFRFLRNVMGLWVLNETLRTWRAQGRRVDLAEVLAEAAEVPPLRAVVDVDAPVFLPPGDMPERIAAACESTGQPLPRTPAETVRCIVDSLALAYRRTVAQAAELAGTTVEVVHVIGGGVHNKLLCQLTADACGVPVLAGPVEATALGNVLVQARTLGADLPDLTAMRALVRRTQQVRTYLPANTQDWSAAQSRLSSGTQSLR
jgi:rhamnulokinase